jgi:transposase InsO family protein
MNTASIGNAKYFMLFIDDFSRMTTVYFLKQQSEAFDKFREYKTYVENFHNLKIKRLRSDNGKEYTSNQFIDYLKDSGIQHE